MQTISEKSHENSIYCAATSHQTNFENFNWSEDPEQAFWRSGKSKQGRWIELSYGAGTTTVFSNADRKRSIHQVKEAQVIYVILKVQRMADIKFLLPVFVHYQEAERLKEYIKWSRKAKCSDLLSNSLNLFFKEMHGDQSGKLVFGYWSLND